MTQLRGYHFLAEVTFKCILGINLSPTNKNLLIISFIYIHIQNKILPSIGILLNGVLTPNLLNNPFASCLLINLDLLLLHISHFYNIINLPLLVLETCGFMFFVYFLHFKQYDSIFYTYALLAK